MFSQGTSFAVDEFRNLLKSYLGWTGDGTFVDERLHRLSVVLGVSDYVVKSWVAGLSRPTPALENKLVPQIKGMIGTEGKG